MNSKRFINIFWLFFEKFGLILLSFCSFIAFAFFLTPAQLGLGALVIVISELVGSFYNAIFENPLVKRNCQSRSELSCVFWFGGVTSLVTMLLVSLLFYLIDGDNPIWQMLVLSALSVSVSSLSRPFIAFYRCKMEYKRLALRTIWGKVIGAVSAITAAYYGAAEWSLIIQLTVMNSIALFVLMLSDSSFIYEKPTMSNFYSIVKEGLSIGLRKLFSGLFGRGLFFIISAVSDASTVGYYSFGRRVVELPSKALRTALTSYSLPVFAKRTDRITVLSKLYFELNICLLLLLFPCFVFFGLIGRELIPFLFGSKWEGAMDFLCLFAFVAGVQLLDCFSQSLQAAFGQSKIGIKADLLKTVILLILAYYLGLHFGLNGIALVLFIEACSSVLIRYLSVIKLLEIDTYKFWTDVTKISFITLLNGVAIYSILLQIDINLLNLLALAFAAILIQFALYSLSFDRWFVRIKLLLTSVH